MRAGSKMSCRSCRTCTWSASAITSRLCRPSPRVATLTTSTPKQAFESQRAEVELKFASMKADFEQHKPAWFNNDQTYVTAISNSIDFKCSNLDSLAASACGRKRNDRTPAPHFCV